LKWAFATAGLVYAGENTAVRSLRLAMFTLPEAVAARGHPNTAPVANIATPPRRNVWREIPRSGGRLRFIVMDRILNHSAQKNQGASAHVTIGSASK
jgi:hypothetical protein